MAPHASFSRHPQGQRPTSPHENTAMGSVPEGASGVAARSHQMLNPSPLLPTSDWLPMELTMPEYLRNVTGVEDLRLLKHLKIRVIAREASIQRIGIYAPSLLQLDLQGSFLGSLRDLGCDLVCLEVLSVGRCGLVSLDGTLGFPALKDLTASYNRIRDVGPCAAVEHLRFLDLKGNLISDVERIGFLSICPKLEELILAECPVAGVPNYRRAILKMLPTLRLLDGTLSERAASSNEALVVSGEDGEDSGLSSLEESEKSGEGASGGVPGAGKPRRAASAVARLQGGAAAVSTGARTKRPQTARIWRPPAAGGGDLNDPGSFALPDEAPSSLTSGITLCGNIAAALLSGRMIARKSQEKRRAAQVPTPAAEAASWRGGSKGMVTAACRTPAPGDPPRSDILEASRRWREAYASFRERNREKWAREDEEDEEEDKEKNQPAERGPRGRADPRDPNPRGLVPPHGLYASSLRAADGDRNLDLQWKQL